MSIILDGKKVSDVIEKTLRRKIKKLSGKLKLSIILVGENSASLKYVEKKQEKCHEIGIKCDVVKLNPDVSEEALLFKIKELNLSKSTTGILIQLPLPSHIKARKVLDFIDVKKDVDGLSSYYLMKILFNDEEIIPATPKGIISLLDEYKIGLRGKNVCVVGFSDIVGKPLVMMCLNRGATVSVAHVLTRDLKLHTSNADIIMTATGTPGLIKKNMIKEGAVVVDVGISKLGGRIVGDVDFENAKSRCSYITPVPGGVGPMTVISLIENLILLSKQIK